MNLQKLTRAQFAENQELFDRVISLAAKGQKQEKIAQERCLNWVCENFYDHHDAKKLMGSFQPELGLNAELMFIDSEGNQHCPDAWADEMRQTKHKHYLKNGDKTIPTLGSTAINPYLKGSINRTQQMALQKENPALAAKLKKDAEAA
jgi:hypothetical protein